MREEWSCAKRRRRHWHCFRWQSLGFEAGWYSLGLADFELFFSWEFSRMVETRNLTKQEIVLNILCLLVNSGIDEQDLRYFFWFPSIRESSEILGESLPMLPMLHAISVDSYRSILVIFWWKLMLPMLPCSMRCCYAAWTHAAHAAVQHEMLPCSINSCCPCSMR